MVSQYSLLCRHDKPSLIPSGMHVSSRAGLDGYQLSQVASPGLQREIV